jgi:hypothetical protein
VTTLLSASPRDIAVHLAVSAEASTELIHQLHELHSQQWALEDASRYPDATADQVAVAKGAIDSCNSRRHRLIDAIDASVAYAPSATASRHYSETIGELCDRLLIFDLKLDALAQRHPDDGEHSPKDAIRQVCDHLSLHIAELLDDMAAGRALLPPRVGVKVYRPHRPPTPRRDALHVSSPGK